MPNKNKHLQIVAQNYKVLSHLSKPNPSDYTDWCVTIVYYMALHFVHAYLAEKKDQHITIHSVLQKTIKDDPNLKSIYSDYRHLQDDSQDARYSGLKLSIYNMRNINLKSFKKIQNKIIRLLKISDANKHDLYPLFPSS